MKEATWIIDVTTGSLTVEGLQQADITSVADDLLPTGKLVNCGRPITTLLANNRMARVADTEPSLQVWRIYHHSVVEGPGRRSVLQTAGCEQRCPGCYVPETHDLNGGSRLSISEVATRLLAAEGTPRDGITILGGEPLLQPEGLLALMQLLKEHEQHITLYTGFTLEELLGRDDVVITQILALTDILIDGSFVKERSDQAGEWRGSTNQRIIYQPARHLSIPNDKT